MKKVLTLALLTTGLTIVTINSPRLLLAAPNYAASSNNPQQEVTTKNPEQLRLSLNVDRPDFDNEAKITSVSQFKDVKPTDGYFRALQSLTERYGIVVAYKDGNFHSEILLSRGQFAMFLDQGLDLALKLKELSGKDIDVYKQFSAKNIKLSSVSKIKDLSPKSPYYKSVKSLTERYGINFVDADRKFRPEQPLTSKELENWLDGVFRTGKKPITNGKINRGQFVMRLNDTLDLIIDRVDKE